MEVYGCNPNGGATRLSTFGNARQKLVNPNIKPFTISNTEKEEKTINHHVIPCVRNKNKIEVLLNSRYYFSDVGELCEKFGWKLSTVMYLLQCSRDYQSFNYHGQTIERVF